MATWIERLMTSPRITRGLAACVMVMGLVSSLAVTAIAQSNARPDKGVRPTGSYAVSDIENINMTNGNANVSIPLASLPPIAGGKLSWTVGANYNSKMWDTHSIEEEDTSTIPFTRWTTSRLQLSAIQPWVIGGGYRIDVTESHDDMDWRDPLCGDHSEPPFPCDPDFQLMQAHNKWFKVTLTTPDGTVHELRPADGSGAYNGFARPYLFGYSWKTPATVTPAAMMTYYSYDGSYLWATIDPWDPMQTGPNPLNWNVYLPDGTRIQNRTGNDNQRGQYIFDTNGNRIRIYSTTTGLETTTHFVDMQTLREIRYVFNQAVNPPFGQGKVEYQTFGGTTWATISINFRSSLFHGWAYKIGDPNCPDKAELILNQDLIVVDSIVLPQTEPGVTRQFSFQYNSDTSVPVNYQWRPDCTTQPNCNVSPPLPPFCVRSASKGLGSLSRITMPSGAIVDYSYLADQPDTGSPLDVVVNPTDLPADAVIKKTVRHDGMPAEVWNYSTCLDIGNSTVTGPDGSVVTENSYPHDRALQYTFGGLGKGGLTYRTNQSNRVLIERQWRSNSINGAPTRSTGAEQSVPFNPVVDIEFTTLMDPPGIPAKMSAKKFLYDLNGNVTSETDYDWFDPTLPGLNRDPQGVPTQVPPGATVLRVMANTYYNDSTLQTSPNIYWNRLDNGGPQPLILNALKLTTTGPSMTEFHYDELDNTAPSKGNLTKLRRFKVGTTWLDTINQYDPNGNLTSTKDPKGNTTTFVIDSATHAQPISVTVDPNPSPLVTGDELTTTTNYDFSTGLVIRQTDLNGAVIETEYTNQRMKDAGQPIQDPFDRPGVVVAPAVTSTVDGQQYVGQKRKMLTRYLDNALQVEVSSDLNQENDGLLKSRTSSDMLGRVVLTETSENGTSYTISAQNAYEKMGRITYSSNPKRSAFSLTDGWTRTKRDELGRVVEVATFDGTTQPTETATNWNGQTQTAYNAEQTTVIDQALKKRKSVLDGLGRLVRIHEDPDGLNYQTSYTYDVLGNLTQVSQGTGTENQTRLFTYDALSRLLTAKNPEQVNTSAQMVATSYVYDDASNLMTRTNPNGTTVGFTYDGLNRVKTKTLSVGGTFTYAYDTAVVGKGRLRSVTSADGDGCYYDSYDLAGRVTANHQLTTAGGQQRSYTMSYGYNLAGAMTKEVYPSGKEVRTSYDSAARPSQVSRYIGSTLDKTYASAFTYAPHGAVSSISLAAGKMTEQTIYNARLQPTQMNLRNASTAEILLGLDYGFATTTNNGNMLSQKIRIGGTTPSNPTTTFNQTFTYDPLNRLDTATETNVWFQDYDYDRFGNRWVNQSSTGFTPNPTLCPRNGNDISKLTNRILMTGFSYDVSGNQKTQTRNGQSELYDYDSENRLLSVTVGSQQTGSSVYDGDGRRVKKTAPVSGTTVFVYDAGGQLLAEYTSGAAQPNGTSYLTTDHLGSTRLVTSFNASGNVVVKARHDYLPFGEEIPSTIGRGSVTGYTANDSTRQRFTQKERDSESELDYFLARYYSSAQGRFTSPDDILVGQHKQDPQSWNLYSYAGNNPLIYLDPTGSDYIVFNQAGDEKRITDAALSDYEYVSASGYTAVFKDKDGVLWSGTFVNVPVDASVTVDGSGPSLASPEYINLARWIARNIDDAGTVPDETQAPVSRLFGQRRIPLLEVQTMDYTSYWCGQAIMSGGGCGLTVNTGGAASVEELIEMMNKRTGVVAQFAEGEELAYLKALQNEGSHLLNMDGTSSILIRADVGTRHTALHEWLHRVIQKRYGQSIPNEDQIIERFLERHKKFFRLE